MKSQLALWYAVHSSAKFLSVSLKIAAWDFLQSSNGHLSSIQEFCPELTGTHTFKKNDPPFTF